MPDNMLLAEQAALLTQQFRGQINRYSVNPVFQQLVEPDICIRHQRQRREKMATELTVGYPGLALHGKIKGERIDQHRLPAQELDVICARVLEDHTAIQRRAVRAQRR